MSYAFIDGYGSVLTAESSVVSSDGSQRPTISIGSVLSPFVVTVTGNPSVSGMVNVGSTVSIGNIPSISGAVQISGASPASVVTVKQLGTQVISTDQGLVANAIIHGLSAAGGGGYVDVKVDPSGALVTAPGSVVAFQSDPTKLVANVSVVSAVPASVSGVGVFNTNLIGNGSVLTVPINETRTSIFSQGSTVNAGDIASVLVFAASGANTRNYITDWAISNTGSVATTIFFTEGGASILGKTIAPATGGSNMNFVTPMRNQVTNQPVNIVVGTAASVVHYSLWGYKA